MTLHTMEKLPAYVTYFITDGIDTVGTGTVVKNREGERERGRERERGEGGRERERESHHSNILKVTLRPIVTLRSLRSSITGRGTREKEINIV